jgi:hypothetical protein
MFLMVWFVSINHKIYILLHFITQYNAQPGLIPVYNVRHRYLVHIHPTAFESILILFLYIGLYLPSDFFPSVFRSSALNVPQKL